MMKKKKRNPITPRRIFVLQRERFDKNIFTIKMFVLHIVLTRYFSRGHFFSVSAYLLFAKKFFLRSYTLKKKYPYNFRLVVLCANNMILDTRNIYIIILITTNDKINNDN